jgi:hypothetical protein
MPNWIRAGLIVLGLTTFIISVSAAQGETFTFDNVEGTQEFTGNISNADSDEILVYMDNLQAGDTIYVMAIGSGEVDPYLVVSDTTGTNSLAQDNDSGGGVNAAITFAVEADGNYVLGMFSINGSGEYRIVIGVNTPEIIDTPIEAGIPEADDQISEADTFTAQRNAVQRFSGAFHEEDEEIFIIFDGLEVGDVIYVYAAGLGFVDTYVEVMNPELDETFADDDDSAGGYNSILSFEVEEAGSYTVRLTTIDQIGNYEITVGINTPEIMELVDEPPVFTVPIGGFDCESIDRLGSRPNLSGRTHTREGETWVIHYTLEGVDATTEAYVDAMEEAIARSLEIQFNVLGWLPPPADCGEGGDSRLDIYVVDLLNSPGIGIAVPEGVIGDNPATERVEYFATYSYLIVENDMDFMSDNAALDLMTSTVAHEIHHNIQFGYDFNDDFFGFYEAGATWVETLVYPTSNSVYEYTPDVLSRPDMCIGRDTNLRQYGEWVMIDSFARDLGVESYQYIWEVMGGRQGLVGFYEGLRDLGTTPQEVIQRMAIRNLILDYALAKRFNATVHIEANITGTGLVSPSRNGVQELSVDYIAITEQGRYTFELPFEESLAMTVIGIDTEADTATAYYIGQSGTVDTTPYDYAYVIVLNILEHFNSDDCHYTDWTIRVSDGANAPLATADTEVWNASQFIPVR